MEVDDARGVRRAGAHGASHGAQPLASLAHDHFLSEVARGYGGRDWAGMGRVIAKNAVLAT
jgi:hypothetical protein